MAIKSQTWRFHILGAAVITAFACAGIKASAQLNAPTNHAATIEPFLSDDTLAVAYLDLSKLDPPALVPALLGMAGLPDGDRQQTAQMMDRMKAVLDGAQRAGVRQIYVVLGISDLHPQGGPIAVFPVEGRDAQARVTEQIQGGARIAQAITGGGTPNIRVDRHVSGAIIVGSQAAVDRYSIMLASDRSDLSTPLARLASDGAAVAVVTAPGRDTRRVIRELWPELPAPAAALNRQLLADKLKHVELSIKLPPANFSVQAALETADPESAASFRQVLDSAKQELAKAAPEEHAKMIQTTLELVDQRVEGSRLQLALSPDGPKLAGLQQILSRGVAAARESGIRQQRASAFKQLMLAMLNHESATRTLPAAAIRNAEGKPLLSWRVAILPHLGQQALYSQFKLDEPWDSPHNMALLKQMPRVFADPDPKLAALAREGKTTFQVPIGPETVFYKNEGTRMSEITDGTSLTLAIVEVVPERAVEWTKPADWELDVAAPLAGLQRTDREGFWAARCDGSVHFIPNDIDPIMLRALLTRANANREPQIR